ncbi:MAG: carboxylesterase family protein, partial [Myxococcaceae bacterium]
RQPVDTLLRALPQKRGQILTPGVWWPPVVDGVELPRVPLASLRSGDFARVPLLIGWNRDEGVIHTVSFEENSDDEVRSFTRDSFGPTAAAQVVERYRRATPKEALTDVVTDAVFACGARRVMRAVSGHGVPVYGYQWLHALDDERVPHLGATHSVELFFVFGNTSLGYGPSQAEQPLVDTVMDAWGRFAHGQAPWPAWTADTDALFSLDLPAQPPATRVKQAECDWWDSFEGATTP